MSYRNYIGKIAKNKYEEIKGMTAEELYKYFNDGKTPKDGFYYTGVYDIVTDKLHELGQYVDAFPSELFTSFFTNNDLQESYNEEYEFQIVGKEFLEAVIARYTEYIRKYYQKMVLPFQGKDKFSRSEFLNTITTCSSSIPDELGHKFDFSKITPEEESQLFNIINHVMSMGREWGVGGYDTNALPYDFRDNQSVTTSCKYEYNQFNLIRILKTFDWENDVMVYYGW